MQNFTEIVPAEALRRS